MSFLDPRVAGVVRAGEFTGDAPPTIVRCERFVAGAFRRDGEAWPVISLRQLLENPGFLDAAA